MRTNTIKLVIKIITNFLPSITSSSPSPAFSYSKKHKKCLKPFSSNDLISRGVGGESEMVDKWLTSLYHYHHLFQSPLSIISGAHWFLVPKKSSEAEIFKRLVPITLTSVFVKLFEMQLSKQIWGSTMHCSFDLM